MRKDLKKAIAERPELQKAIAEAAATAGLSTGGRSAFADLVMEIVEPNHLSLDLFSAFMPTRQLNPGDEIGKRVRRGRYPIRTMVPGAKHLHDVLSFQQQQTYMFDRLIAGTSHNVWEIRSGEVGTVDQFKNELRADLFDELVSRVFSLLITVWNSTDTPNNFVDASSTGLTAAALDAMIETLLDYTGSIRAIVGSRQALLPLYSFAQYREFALTGSNTDAVAFQTEAFNEFTSSKKVSTYFGIPVIELPQVYRNRLGFTGANGNTGLRDATNRMIDTSRVLVIGEDAGSVALMGGTEYQDYTDASFQPANYVLHAWQAYGMIVEDAERIGVLKIA
jgi:hypothetical protein